MKKNYKDFSRKELIEKIDEMEKSKKYGLVWEDKTENVVKRCKKELPVLEEDKKKEIITDKNKPVNILIEGDNYHSLSVLNYTHAGKIDVIYIDPPYNTGSKDFIFNDRYIDKEDTYRHSKWLSFISKRLRLAKNLLKPNGIIFISIDNNEIAQMKLLMDNPSLFGEGKFFALLTWIKRTKPTNIGEARFNIQQNTEYILVYGNTTMAKHPRFNLPESEKKEYPHKDKIGKYRIEEVVQRRNLGILRRDTMLYSLLGIKLKDGYRWQLSQKKYKELLENKRLKLVNNKPYVIIYDFEEESFAYQPFWSHLQDVGTAESGKANLNDILGIGHEFETVKPLELLKKILFYSTKKNSIVLDFFAGSGSTGHAVLNLNNKDGGNRKFILSTNNENNNGNGFKIAEDICYPRIKRVMKGYVSSKKQKFGKLGGNLKYFKTDFVSKDNVSDDTKYSLLNRSMEMICLKEDTFEKVIDQKYIKIFKNQEQYTAILFHLDHFDKFKEKLKKLDKHIHIYVFSLSNDTYEDDFKGLKQKFDLCPIPESILEVYRRIFKEQ